MPRTSLGDTGRPKQQRDQVCWVGGRVRKGEMEGGRNGQRRGGGRGRERG